MKVLLVLDTFYPKVDGPANVVRNLAQNLNKMNLAETEVLVPKYPKYKDNEDFKIYRTPSIYGTDGYRASVPFVNSNVKKIIQNGGFDLIHIHSPFTLGKYVAKVAKKLNIPVLLTVHTDYESDFKRKLKTKTLRKFMMNYILKVMNTCDSVYTVSSGAREKIYNYGYKKEIGVITNATSTVDNKDLTTEIAKVKEKFGIKDEFIFLYVGRVVENKNIQFSLQVLKLLKESGFEKFKFLIVGKGDYQKKLKKMVEDFNLSSNVIFVGFVEENFFGCNLQNCRFVFVSIFF